MARKDGSIETRTGLNFNELYNNWAFWFIVVAAILAITLAGIQGVKSLSGMS